MDAVSYSHADKQKQRIEKFIEQPDSTSGLVTVPDTIATGESIEIPEGRQVVVDHLDVQGTLDIQGTLATVSGGYLSQTTMKTESIVNSANSASPVDFAVTPTFPAPSFTNTTSENAINQAYFFNATNFDGIEYADEGLLGVPDTSFSSTGARIYPDGTIRGKSSYGEYVKYPDGRLECYSGLVPTVKLTPNNGVYCTATRYYWIYPYVPANDISKCCFTAVSRIDGIQGYASSWASPNPITQTSASVYVSVPLSNGNQPYLNMSLTGTWK